MFLPSHRQLFRAFPALVLPSLVFAQVTIKERVEIKPQLDSLRVPSGRQQLAITSSGTLRLDISSSGSLQPDYPSNFFIARNACQPGGLIFLRDPGRSISVPALASVYSYGATVWAFAGASVSFMLYLDGEQIAHYEYPNLPAKGRYYFPHWAELFETFSFTTEDTLIAKGEQAAFNINGATSTLCAPSVWHPELQMTLTIITGQELGGFLDEDGDTLGTSVTRKGSEMKGIRFYAKSQKTPDGESSGNVVVVEAASKGITRSVQIRIKPGIKIKVEVAHKTLQPLGDSDNKENPDTTERKDRPKVIDFSKVKLTTVTVKVVDTEDKPVSDYDFTMRALVRGGSGGHDHSEGRPTGRFVTEDKDTLAAVEGKTGAEGTAKYTYLCSGIGGVDSIFVQGRTPDDTATATILSKMGEFELLKDGTTYKLIGQTSIHPVNHYGTSKTLSRLRQLADSACAHSKWVLQYNDISLLYGGPFDVGKANPWDTPHQTHREGRHVDMRPVSVNGDSIKVQWIQDVVLKLLKGTVREESPGIEGKHHFHLGF